MGENQAPFHKMGMCINSDCLMAPKNDFLATLNFSIQRMILKYIYHQDKLLGNYLAGKYDLGSCNGVFSFSMISLLNQLFFSVKTKKLLEGPVFPNIQKT